MSQANPVKSGGIYRSEASYQDREAYQADTFCEIREVPFAALKRAFDLTATLIGLVVLFPLFLMIGVLIRATSPGPILFRQRRVGLGGRLFWCYKFRSMTIDAESRQKELLHLNEVDGPVFKIKNDPRVTPLGRILRKLSLDELPQLFNVVIGDMSLVGPRPPLPSEVGNYTQQQRQRLAVLPGITCTWQASGRSAIGFAEWVQMDLEYIDSMTFWGDLKIIARTVPAVLAGRGAH